jgi:uncharacterized surface protein with fasciclin (FAS1) repeats
MASFSVSAAVISKNNDIFAQSTAYLRPLLLVENTCLKTDFIDVRGSDAIDGALDGMKDGKVTIAEVAVVNPLENLGELVNAVLAADPAVLAAIADPAAVLTVFAPVDQAFLNIPGGILNGIVTEGALTSVLLYHVVAGEFDPRIRKLYINAEDSLLGQDLFIKQSLSSPTINQSNIECAGVRTDNGLVWLIDSVLIPQF